MPLELPEERLLNLIKGKNKKKPEEKHLHHIPGASPSISRVATTALGKIRHSKVEALRVTNKYLLGLLFLTLCYSGYVFFFSVQDRMPVLQENHSKTVLGKEDKSSLKDLARPKMGDYAGYAPVFGSKQLFKTGENAPSEDVVQSASIAGKFNLVGIMPGANPQAIIEDRETGKTYYLYKGASFDGGVVQEIGNGRVVLDYKGEKINLVL